MTIRLEKRGALGKAVRNYGIKLHKWSFTGKWFSKLLKWFSKWDIWFSREKWNMQLKTLREFHSILKKCSSFRRQSATCYYFIVVCNNVVVCIKFTPGFKKRTGYCWWGKGTFLFSRALFRFLYFLSRRGIFFLNFEKLSFNF